MYGIDERLELTVMDIERITDKKRDYMEMLLLADPQESMIDRYLDQGEMYVLYDHGRAVTAAVVADLGGGKCELKNISTIPEEQRKGYGRYMIHFLCEHYSGRYDLMYVGTGNSPDTLGFYHACGFVNSHIVANFFVDNYEEPIYENGIRLTDMIYLKKKLDSELDVKKVVDLAVEAGRILLKNGAEIFRVEETMDRICKRFHVDYVDSFTLSHAIFITAEKGMNEVYTKVKNVPLSGAHLGIVTEVNALSREISAGKIGIDEAWEKLRAIEQIPPKKGYFQVLAAGVGSAAFGYLLGASVNESLVAFGIGCLLYLWVLFAKKLHMSKIIVNIVGGALITLLAVLALHVPALGVARLDGMIVGAIMPLVPGLAFTNAIRDIANSDFLSGTVRMIDALMVLVYIAIGVGTMLSIYNNMIGGITV